MHAKQAYHRLMRYWTLVSTLFLAVLVALSAPAQVNGVPPSVTSFGFGGQPGFHGTPPSVTSVGPTGFAQHPTGIHQPLPQHPRSGGHHHRQGYAYPYYIPYYPVVDPSYYGQTPDDQASVEEPDQYQGGPTIFDRRGTGTPLPNDYVTDPPKARVPRPDPAPHDDADAASDPPPAPVAAAEANTILVFRDGHKLEVSNYAIVGTNLFDLTPGHRQKVALADLDVAATQKANDDQGVDFKLPSLSDVN